MSPLWRRIAGHLAALALCLGFALRTLEGFAAHAASHLAPDIADPLLNLVLLKWGAHQWRLGLSGFWDANFFFPTGGVIALSEHLSGPALAMAGFTALVPNAVLGYNLLLLSALAFSPFALVALFRRLGFGWTPAVVAALGWGFASCRVDQLPHLQMLLALWIPPLLWTLDRLLERPTPTRAAAFFLFYAVHVSGGVYLALMSHVMLAAVVVVRRRELLASARRGKEAAVLAGAGLAASALLAAIFLPYGRHASALGLERGENEILQFGATWASYLVPCRGTALFRPPVDALFRAENSLFPGLVTLLLAAVALAARGSEGPRTHLGVGRRWLIGALGLLSLAGFALGDYRTWTASPRLTLATVAFPLEGYLIPAILAILPLAAAWRLCRRGRAVIDPPVFPLARSPLEQALLAGAAVSFLLSLPLAFVPVARIVPGFAGMRVSARFAHLAALGLALLAARGAERLLSAAPGRLARLAFSAALLAALAFELLPAPPGWNRVATDDEMPAVDRWIAAHAEVRAILDLPLAAPEKPWREAISMYLASVHWKGLVNGYSGHLTPSYVAVRDRIDVMPEDRALRLLRGMGVTHIVARTGLIWEERWRREPLVEWENRLARGDGPAVEQVYEDGEGDRVYRILPGETEPWPPPVVP